MISGKGDQVTALHFPELNTDHLSQLDKCFANTCSNMKHYADHERDTAVYSLGTSTEERAAEERQSTFQCRSEF